MAPLDANRVNSGMPSCAGCKPAAQPTVWPRLGAGARTTPDPVFEGPKLVGSQGFPLLDYHNPHHVKGNMIPELIINQQGFLKNLLCFGHN